MGFGETFGDGASSEGCAGALRLDVLSNLAMK